MVDMIIFLSHESLDENFLFQVKAETDSMTARMDNLISRAKSIQLESEQVLAVSNNSESEVLFYFLVCEIKFNHYLISGIE